MTQQLDPQDKNHREILKFLKGKSILIAGGNANTRTAIRSFTKGLLIPGNDVHVAQTVKQALEILENKKPQIVITDFFVDEKKCLPILKKHLEIHPDRSTTVTAVYGSPSPHPDRSQSYDHYVDIFMEKPLVINQLSNHFFEIIRQRMQLNKKQKLIFKGLSPFYLGQQEQALKTIEKLEEKEITDHRLFGAKGLLFESEEKLEEAVEAFDKGIQHNRDNYICIKGKYRALINQGKYREAYAPLQRLVHNHPINPSEIPEMTKVFVAREKFEEIVDFCDKFVSFENLDQLEESSEESEEEGLLESLERIAICLVAIARFLTRKEDYEKAKQTLLKATQIVDPENVRVIGGVINELINLDEKSKAYELLMKITPSKLDDNLMILKLFLEQDRIPAHETLQKGLGLIQKGVKDIRIYNMVIQKSVSLKKREDFIDDIIIDATKVYPQMTDHFQRLKKRL